MLYGMVQWYVYGHGDTFDYVKSAKKIHSLLPEHLDDYTYMTFGDVERPIPPEIKEHLGGEKVKYYAHTRNYMMVRINSFLNLFTFGNYYANAVFFAFFSFIGIYHLILFFSKYFPKKTSWFKWIICFFPSILFWGSGLHKDALTLLCLGLLLCSIQKLMSKKWIYLLMFLFSAYLLFSVRNYVFLILCPALFGFLFTNYFPKWKFLKFSLLYAAGFFLFFYSSKIDNRLNFPAEFVETQQHFRDLGGDSTFDMEVLEPTTSSFLSLTPTAFKNTLFKPAFSELKSWLHGIALVDNYLFLSFLIGLLFLGSFKGITSPQKALLFFCLFFGVSFLLTIGILVTNLGALVRYEITANIFLLAAATSIYDEKKVLTFLQRLRIK